MINQVNSVAGNLIQGYFVPYAQLLCEFFVTTSILVGLITFNIYVFLLVVFTFVPITWTYYRFSRSRIKEYGKQLNLLNPQRGKLLQQTFIGFTDMEMNNTCLLYTSKLWLEWRKLHQAGLLLDFMNTVGNKGVSDYSASYNFTIRTKGVRLGGRCV